MSKSKNWKNGENTENFKFEKPKIGVLGNVVSRAHATFQEAAQWKLCTNVGELRT